MPNAPATLPTLTVGLTPIQLITVTDNGTGNGFNHHRWSLSVSVQSDPTNIGLIFVGDVNVSSSRYSRVLRAGDFYTAAGSAVDPSDIWIVSDTAAQIAHPSRN